MEKCVCNITRWQFFLKEISKVCTHNANMCWFCFMWKILPNKKKKFAFCTATKVITSYLHKTNKSNHSRCYLLQWKAGIEQLYLLAKYHMSHLPLDELYWHIQEVIIGSTYWTFLNYLFSYSPWVTQLID